MRLSFFTEKKKSKEPCFLCGGADSFEAEFTGIKAEGRSYDLLFCKTCKLGKTDPFLDEKKLKEIYSSAVYREDDSTRFFSPIEKIISLFRTGRCKRVERYSGTGRILDIGCGRGDFLALMAGRGWGATGLELDRRILSQGRRVKGVDLRFGGLEDVKFPEAHFNAVTFWHVFEHLRDPLWALRECNRILKPGGLLVVAVPNYVKRVVFPLEVLPLVLVAVGLVLPAADAALFALAGLSVFVTGWAIKFILITRAAFNQGFALPHTPIRGSGLPGPAVKPGWTLP